MTWYLLLPIQEVMIKNSPHLCNSIATLSFLNQSDFGTPYLKVWFTSSHYNFLRTNWNSTVELLLHMHTCKSLHTSAQSSNWGCTIFVKWVNKTKVEYNRRSTAGGNDPKRSIDEILDPTLEERLEMWRDHDNVESIRTPRYHTDSKLCCQLKQSKILPESLCWLLAIDFTTFKH